MEEFSVIVLAAGKGKRMKSSLPKVLHGLCGQPLIYYILRQLFALKKYVKQIAVITGYKSEAVEKEVKKLSRGRAGLGIKVDFVRQAQMLGTADAVKAAAKKIKNDNVLILCADAPLITAKTLASLISFYLRKKLLGCVLTAKIDEKNSLGVILRDEKGKPVAIREKVGHGGNMEGAEEVNSGVYCFKRADLFKNLPKIVKNKKKGEYFLTDIVEIFHEKRYKFDTYLLADNEEILGINTKSDLYAVERLMRGRILERFIERGIKVIDPETTFIQEGVSVGRGSIIYPFTFIEKGVIIGKNCSLGPFIHLRGGSCVGDDTQAGNFLEINRSKIGKGVRIKHFGYLGDAVIEDNANIGAGTVTANFNGKSKNKTYIKKGAFIGSDTVLVAPVKVDERAVTGAGSVVTKNVKAGATVVGVPAKPLKRIKKSK